MTESLDGHLANEHIGQTLLDHNLRFVRSNAALKVMSSWPDYESCTY
jgi:hypothetical protein